MTSTEIARVLHGLEGAVRAAISRGALDEGQVLPLLRDADRAWRQLATEDYRADPLATLSWPAPPPLHDEQEPGT